MMPFTQSEIDKRWRLRHPEKVRAANRRTYEKRMQNKEQEYSRVREYRHTLKGRLSFCYAAMRTRVSSPPSDRQQYKGLPLLSKADFVAWSLNDLTYLTLHAAWEHSGYERKLCPSIDRIDPKQGYELHNMQWLTLGQNSAKGNYQRSLYYND